MHLVSCLPGCRFVFLLDGTFAVRSTQLETAVDTLTRLSSLFG
jgi:hypothetical protein